MLSTAHRTPGLPGRAEHQQQQQQQQHWITATSTTATVNTNHKLSPGRLVSGSAGGGGGGAGAVPVSPADTNRSASDIPSPVSTTASQYHHQHHQQLQQQQHGEGRALSDVGTSSALEGDVDGHSHVYNYDAAHIRPSCIIRRGLLVHRNASGIVAGKKKPKHVFLCRPMTTDDIMFLRDSVAAAERESNQRSMDDVWLETTLQSASKAARDGEVELYGHLAYAAVTAHPLMVVAGGTSKIFIHMTNVAAVLEETDLGAACHFSILTTSRQEFKFSTETSPEYQLWIEDLLDAHYECRWADDARSIRSGLSSRSGRSARNRTTRYRSPVASVSQHSVSRDTSPNGVRSGLPRAASSNSIASKSYHLTGDGTYQAEPVYVQARPRGRSTPQTFAERTSSLAVPASSSIHSGAGQVDPGGTEISEVSIAAEQTLTVPTQRATKLVQEEGTSLNTTPTLTNSSVPRTPESNPNNVDEELESIRAGSLVRFATNKELPKLAAESTGPVPMGRKCQEVALLPRLLKARRCCPDRF
ncbi:hypothetical protein DFJ73DRAFT_548798 [Zopfochytrium polystomum]|nr:hypothetical protein DFJ73DRAFT_548798 [Zopfochytrium polystomum]